MKTAIVFSGGGSRGAYQVGAWKALNELGIKADIVVGTSIGSVTAALYIVDKIDEAIKLYNKLSIKNIFNEDKLGFHLEPVNLRRTLEEHIDYDKFINSNIDYGLVTVSFPSLRKHNITKNKMSRDNYIDYLIASCSIPLLFKKPVIDNKKYVDGGVKEPVPVKLAEKLGADKIIIINTSFIGKNYKLKNNDYICIKPSKKIISPIKFDAKTSKELIELGYNDTIRVFKELEGDI